MDIIQYPNKILTDKTLLVNKKEIEYLSALIERAFRSIPCAGIAAPQIGESKRIFVARGDIFINPRIIRKSTDIERFTEGCLSLKNPDKNYLIPRSKSVTLEWEGLDGRIHKNKFFKYDAEVIQHEFDHLMGKLLIHY